MGAVSNAAVRVRLALPEDAGSPSFLDVYNRASSFSQDVQAMASTDPAQSGSTRSRPIGAVHGRLINASSAASRKLNRAVISRMPPRNHPAAPEASRARITKTS